MADQVKYPGRLIAVDGSRGKDVTRRRQRRRRQRSSTTASSARSAAGTPRACSASWPRRPAAIGNISIRTLSLVYAADLAFRLRWEIRPVLEAGGVVIAAPYIETAVAFGAACGLDEEWLRQLMRFAPAADFRGLADERKIDRPWKRRTDRGYRGIRRGDAGSPRRRSASRSRRAADMMTMLDRARGRKVFHLTDKGIGALAQGAY